MQERLQLIDEALVRACPAAGVSHGLADVCAQLCGWTHSGYAAESCDYDHVMRAAL